MTQWRKNTRRTIKHCARHCTLIYIISHNFCSFSLIGLLRGVREQIPSPLFLGRRAVICSLSGVPSTSPFSCHQRLLSPQNMARPDTTTHSVWKRRCSQQSSATLIFIISLCTLFFSSSFFSEWRLVGGGSVPATSRLVVWLRAAALMQHTAPLVTWQLPKTFFSPWKQPQNLH